VSAAFTDEPTLRDQLNRADWVKWFACNLRNCQTPYVFGVHGDWGSGKTSFLHQLYFHLTGRPVAKNQQIGCPADPFAQERKNGPPIVTVWFEAWRFQHDPAPVVALLQHMRKQLTLDVQLVRKASKLTEVTVRSLLGMMDKIAAGIYSEVVPIPHPDAIEKIGEKYEAERFEMVSSSAAIREQLEEVIKQLISEKGRIIILVDDLDRCQPEAAFKLLEGIKIYLNLPSCVFVLAMDHRNLERALAQCLPGAARDPKTGFPLPGAVQQAREYLEKICQDVWQLPLIPTLKHEEFLRRQFFDEEKNSRPGDEEFAATFESILKSLAVETCLPANARKLKAYANTLRRFVFHCLPHAGEKSPDGETWHARMLLIMSCLYQFHPELYRRLESRPRFYNEIVEWARSGLYFNKVFENIEIAGSGAGATGGGLPGDDPPAGPFVNVPDPAVGNVFRLRTLVIDHGPVTEDEVTHYLLRYARV
jgi:hypothetical protein